MVKIPDNIANTVYEPVRVVACRWRLGSQLCLKGWGGAAEPPMMIRLSTEVSVEGEGGHHPICNEVKAKEVITSWKNSVLCVWVWGGHSGKPRQKSPSFSRLGWSSSLWSRRNSQLFRLCLASFAVLHNLQLNVTTIFHLWNRDDTWNRLLLCIIMLGSETLPHKCPHLYFFFSILTSSHLFFIRKQMSITMSDVFEAL